MKLRCEPWLRLESARDLAGWLAYVHDTPHFSQSSRSRSRETVDWTGAIARQAMREDALLSLTLAPVAGAASEQRPSSRRQRRFG